MKRILSSILFATIITTSAIADETKNVDLKSDYKNSKEMMNELKTIFPDVHTIATDYFQAKTCKEDITTNVSMKEIGEFTTTKQYGVLIALKHQDAPIAKANYSALINAYKAMNCGSEEALGTYIGATSAIAVEMNSK